MENTMVINLVMNEDGVYVDENEVKSFGDKLRDKFEVLMDKVDFDTAKEVAIIFINMIASATTWFIKVAIIMGILRIVVNSFSNK